MFQIKSRTILELVIALAIFTSLSFYLHARSDNVADLDGMYHFRHASVFRERGLADTSFPWTEFSVFKKEGADPWYGFHMLLIPFSYFSDLTTGMKAASIFITTASLLLIFFAFRRLGIKWPIFWTLAFLFSTHDILFRFTALRPQLISFGLILLFFSYLARHQNGKKIFDLPLFAISAVTAWIHLAFVWMPFLLIFVTGFWARLFEKKWRIEWVLPTVAGVVLGVLLHPNPMGTLKLTYIQMVRLMWEKQAGTPLLFGTEVLRFTSQNFWDQFIPVTLLLVLAIYFWVKFPHEKKVALASCVTVSAIFFYLSFSSARRSSDFFFGFAWVFIGLIFSRFNLSQAKLGIRNLAAFLLFFIVIGTMAGVSLWRYEALVQKSYDPRASKGAAEWLTANSQAGDIVFHPYWDQFAELFFWNTKNRYINGMDPIFEYVYDPSLYWKHHFFSIGWATEFTCPAIRCTADMLEESYKVLKEDFRAKFIYIQKNRSTRLYEYLGGDTRYKKAFENDKDAVFSL